MDLINEKNDDNIVLSHKYPSVQKESINNIIMICVGCSRFIIIILFLAFFLSTWIFLWHNAILSSTFLRWESPFYVTVRLNSILCTKDLMYEIYTSPTNFQPIQILCCVYCKNMYLHFRFFYSKIYTIILL